jgi:hypothetical protein
MRSKCLRELLDMRGGEVIKGLNEVTVELHD